MTIFDAIRFPNIDILNKKELDKLPRGLLELWATVITQDIKYPFDLDVKDVRNDFSKIAYNTVLTKVRASRTVNFTSKIILFDACKKQLTDTLKRMLGEYESPL